MGDMTIPPGCYSSFELCIDALCAEQSKGRSAIDWKNRGPDTGDFYLLQDNMTPPSKFASWHEPSDWVHSSMKNDATSWASRSNFSTAYSHQDSTPLEKAQFRKRVAEQYLSDHPDDCQPPAPPPAPSRQRSPSKQLSLFGDAHPTLSHRVSSESAVTSAWWTTTPWVVVGAATLAAEYAGTIASSLDKAIGYSLWGVWEALSPTALLALDFEYFYQSCKKDPIL